MRIQAYCSTNPHTLGHGTEQTPVAAYAFKKNAGQDSINHPSVRRSLPERQPHAWFRKSACALSGSSKGVGKCRPS